MNNDIPEFKGTQQEWQELRGPHPTTGKLGGIDDTKPSELLQQSAIPFDRACILVKQLEERCVQLETLLKVAKCPNCDGSGGIPKQVSARTYVTREMAMDAGSPEMEGSLYSDDEFEMEQCQWCYERNQLLK